MGDRRMFSRRVTGSDNFVDLPASTRALYFHMGLEADDDGFLTNPKSMVRSFGCSNDDLNLLVDKGFVIRFDSGVVCIRHWRAMNTIKNDRYKPTTCEEIGQLEAVNGVYELSGSRMDPKWNQNGSRMDPQYNISKSKIIKDNLSKGNLSLKRDIINLLSIDDGWKSDLSIRRAVASRIAEYLGDTYPEMLKDGEGASYTKIISALNVGINPEEIDECAYYCANNREGNSLKREFEYRLGQMIADEIDRPHLDIYPNKLAQ